MRRTAARCGFSAKTRQTWLVDVGDVEHRPQGEEGERPEQPRLGRGELERACDAAGGEVPAETLEQTELGLDLRLASLGLTLQSRDGLLHRLEVRQYELGIDDLDVAARIDAPHHVDHVFVVETAHHVGDRLNLADVREELVPQPLAVGCALNQTRDVDEGHHRGGDLLRLDFRRDRVEPGVGHRHHAGRGLDGAEWIIRRAHLRPRERIEERRLTDVGQTYDAAAETHADPCSTASVED